MPRGFGLAATRRANFKMPTVQLQSEHFTVSPTTMGAGTLAAADAVADSKGFTTFTIAASPAGPFAASVDLTGSTTCYIRANNPYPLVKPVAVTIS